MSCIEDLINSKINKNKKSIAEVIIELLKENKIDICELQNSIYYSIFLKNSKDESIYSE